MPLKKSFGFLISVVNSDGRNVLKEGYDSKDGKGKEEAAEKRKGPSLSLVPERVSGGRKGGGGVKKRSH